MSLLVLQGPPKSGKSKLIKQIAELAFRETRPLQPHTPVPWQADCIYTVDVNKVDIGLMAWLHKAAFTVDIIVETRDDLPDFNTPVFKLEA